MFILLFSWILRRTNTVQVIWQLSPSLLLIEQYYYRHPDIFKLEKNFLTLKTRKST